MAAAPRWTRLFPRDIAALPAIFAYVADYIQQAGFGGAPTHDADLVAEEIFTNLVRHNRGEREIEISLVREDHDLVMTVRDFDVEPFDPTHGAGADGRASGDGDPGDLRAGGRGITLVKRLTKEFRYDYADRTSTLTTRLGFAGPQET